MTDAGPRAITRLVPWNIQAFRNCVHSDLFVVATQLRWMPAACSAKQIHGARNPYLIVSKSPFIVSVQETDASVIRRLQRSVGGCRGKGSIFIGSSPRTPCLQPRSIACLVSRVREN